MPKLYKLISNLITYRAFISFNVDDSVIEDVLCVQDDLKTFYLEDKISWIKPENFHMTLRFLGEITEETIEIVKENLSNIQLYFNMIEYFTQDIGYFPDVKSPSAIFISLKETKNYTDIFLSKLNKLFAKLNIKHSRKFAPHITLGRFKRKINEEVNLYHEEINKFKLSFDSFNLMKSKLTSNGPIYSIVKDYKFMEE